MKVSAWFAAVVIAVPALALAPVTDRIYAERRALKFGGAAVNRQMRDVMGQGLAIGLLAGFRGVVADFVWLQSQGYWEHKEWLRQYRDLELTTTLQPQSILFWDVGAWHMAWNIGYAVSVDPANRTKAEGLKRQHAWHERAQEFLERGIENVPNRYDLYFALGWLYLHKFHDDCRAEQALRKAAEFKEAPVYVGRVHAQALQKCGMLTEAYEYWRTAWLQKPTGIRQEWNVVEREIRRLEEQLNIPDEKRIFPLRQSK